MNEILKTLAPEKIWHFFGEVLNIPRPSKKEEKIRAYLMEFGKSRGLETLSDATGNVLIRKPATPGYENRVGVILQSHMDMVCEKNADSTHNFDTDPIEVHIDGNWLKAKSTTLGADNGIGVAAELAILDSKDIEHGPLECLFTVDEETGLTGAFGLQPGFLQGKILLNLDSEDDGQFFIGCAGGIDTVAQFPIKKITLDNKGQYMTYQCIIKGLKGGHSGDDINKGLGNANKLLGRFLYRTHEKMADFHVVDFNGGNLRNAIAREATATVCVPNAVTAEFEKSVTEFDKIFKNELHTTEPNVQFSCKKTEKATQCLSSQHQEQLLRFIMACPHGVLRMSSDIPNFVETSTNLASIKTYADHILITTSQRSSVESAKYAAADKVAACCQLIGAKVEHSDGYPGWAPNPNSPILKIITSSYEELFHEKALALAIHAGLECGLFEEKYPGLDMVSYGPTMRGVHSPDERLDIPSVKKFWDLTLEVLKKIPQA